MVKKENFFKKIFLQLIKNRMSLIGLLLLGILVVTILIGPLFTPHNYETMNWDYVNAPPSAAKKFYFGTDSLGRDLFSRVMMGGKISLSIGIVASIVCMFIGTLYGAISGYFGSRCDRIMMRIVDILYALPFIFFVIMLMVFFGRNIFLIFIAIGMVEWLDVARIVRAHTMTLKHKAFVENAECTGVHVFFILIKHVIPNLLGPVFIYTMLTIQKVIMTESFLSFLGLGVQEPLASWGVLINEGVRQIETEWWAFAFPAIFLMLSLFALISIGDGLRDAFDPKTK